MDDRSLFWNKVKDSDYIYVSLRIINIEMGFLWEILKNFTIFQLCMGWAEEMEKQLLKVVGGEKDDAM